MNKIELIEETKEKAQFYLREKGLGSRASVFNAVYDLKGKDFMPPEMVGKVDSILEGFFCGVGLMGSSCGALIGGIAALGMVYGGRLGHDYGDNEASSWWIKQRGDGPVGKLLRDSELAPEQKVQRYLEILEPFAVYNRLANRFKQQFGSINCYDIARTWEKDPICRDYFKGCETVVIETAGLTMETICEAEEKGVSSLELGDNMYSKLLQI